MRFVRFSAGGPPREGVLLPDSTILDGSGVWGDDSMGPAWAHSPRQFEDACKKRGDRLDREEVRLLAPVLPGKIIAVGRNYAEHAREGGNEVPAEPLLFGKMASCVCGPGDPIEIPEGMGRVDHEVELGVVIGKTARRVQKGQALEVIAGYTVLNDVTAREMQRADAARGRPWFRAKNFDTFAPIGPCLLTADELSFPPALNLSLRVNGEVRQSAHTRDMVFSVAELIEFITRWMTLDPGDVVATGTPAGVGPLLPGDTVDAVIDEIGMLTNPVVGTA